MKSSLASLLLCLPLAFFGQSASQGSAANSVATVGGLPITEQELLDELGSQWQQLRKQEYEAKSKVLENLIRLKLAQAEAKRQSISLEKLLEQEADSKVAEPTDGEVEAYFLGQNTTDVRFDEMKEQYRISLKRIQQQRKRQAYADSLRAKTDVAITLRPPTVDVT